MPKGTRTRSPPCENWSRWWNEKISDKKLFVRGRCTNLSGNGWQSVSSQVPCRKYRIFILHRECWRLSNVKLCGAILSRPRCVVGIPRHPHVHFALASAHSGLVRVTFECHDLEINKWSNGIEKTNHRNDLKGVKGLRNLTAARWAGAANTSVHGVIGSERRVVPKE